MKGHLRFLSVLTLVLELKLAGKRLWNEDEKIAKKNHSNAKKILCSVKT